MCLKIVASEIILFVGRVLQGENPSLFTTFSTPNYPLEINNTVNQLVM